MNVLRVGLEATILRGSCAGITGILNMANSETGRVQIQVIDTDSIVYIETSWGNIIQKEQFS